MDNRAVTGAESVWQALARVPARTWQVFFICLIGVTFANLDLNLFFLVLTELSTEFDWSITERGWYLAGILIVAGLLITQLGALADRIGRKKVLLGATWLTPFFVAALAVTPNTWSTLLARLLGYTTAGVQSPITGTLVVEEAPPRFRGLFTGVLQIGFPIGFFLAATIVGLVAPQWGWRYVFLAGLLFLPYAFIISRYLRESDSWVSAQASRAGPQAGIRQLFEAPYRRKTIILFVGQLLHAFAYGATLLLPAYFREGRGWNLEEMTTVVSNAYLVGAVGYVAASVASDFWINRRNTIVIWCWLGGLAFAAMLWAVSTPGQMVVAFGATTFFFYGAYAVIFTFIAENFPSHLRATAASFASSLGVEFGLALGPLALSYGIVAWGWEVAFTWCAVVPILIAGCAFLTLQPVRAE